MIPFGKESDQHFSSWEWNRREMGANAWLGKRVKRRRKAGPGDVLPDGDGKMHFLVFLLLLTGFLGALVVGMDTCPVLE